MNATNASTHSTINTTDPISMAMNSQPTRQQKTTNRESAVIPPSHRQVVVAGSAHTLYPISAMFTSALLT
jgi:hypothetical protein